MATFGQTTDTGDPRGRTANQIEISKYTLSEDGYLTQLHSFLSTGGACRMICYADSSGTPGALQAVTTETTPSSGDTTFTVATPAHLAAGDYWLGLWSSGSSGGESRGGGALKYLTATYSSSGNPPSPPGGTDYGEKFLAYGVYDATPINSVAPSVSGSTPVGSTLTCAPGTWSNSPTYTYQWTRAGSNIGSATSSTYVTVEADIGSAIGCKVVATNGVASSAATASSNTITPTATTPANTVAPVASGTATVGQTLSTTNGTWTGIPAPTFTYQWQRDNTGGGSYSNISSATSSSYTLVDADDACHVRCVVTGTNSAGNASANSNALGLVIEPSPTNSVAPVASGTAKVGSTLSVTNGTWTHMGGTVATFTYQWKRGASTIGGATNNTYVLVDADDALTVTCVVSAHNTNASAGNASSNGIAVTEPVPANTVAPVVTGDVGLGETLTCSTGTWSHMGGTITTYTYQWQRDAVNIGGETAAMHVVVSADLGHTINCEVTATNTGGSSSAVDSNVILEPAAQQKGNYAGIAQMYVRANRRRARARR